MNSLEIVFWYKKDHLFPGLHTAAKITIFRVFDSPYFCLSVFLDLDGEGTARKTYRAFKRKTGNSRRLQSMFKLKQVTAQFNITSGYRF